jgi:hypothetical protein
MTGHKIYLALKKRALNGHYEMMSVRKFYEGKGFGLNDFNFFTKRTETVEQLLKKSRKGTKRIPRYGEFIRLGVAFLEADKKKLSQKFAK